MSDAEWVATLGDPPAEACWVDSTAADYAVTVVGDGPELCAETCRYDSGLIDVDAAW